MATKSTKTKLEPSLPKANENLRSMPYGRLKHQTPGGHRLGWKPPLPNKNNKFFSFRKVHPGVVHLPTEVDHVAAYPFRYNQGDSSSCTGQSAMYLFGGLKGVKSAEEGYSRLLYYQNELEFEDSWNQDDGASIGDGIHLLVKKGVCLEKEWPFDIANLGKHASSQIYTDALLNKAISCSNLVDGYDYRQCLAQGFDFTIGISCYESIDGDLITKTGILSMPGENEKVVGGHAICVIGYDFDFWNNPVFKKSGLSKEQCPNQMYHALNSWGSDWGDGGTFWIPLIFLEDADYASDSWTIRV